MRLVHAVNPAYDVLVPATMAQESAAMRLRRLDWEREMRDRLFSLRSICTPPSAVSVDGPFGRKRAAERSSSFPRRVRQRWQ